MRGNGRRSWGIVVLLFVIAFINYLDRQSLSVVAPRMQAELNMNDTAYAHVVSLFLFASTIAYGLSGFLTDRLGTRLSMALFVGWWSLAEAATAFTQSVWSLAVVRFCLGLGEPGLWVAAPKAVGEVFDKRDRGLAIGIYTAGATLGAVAALPFIIFLVTHLPWRSVFLIDGAIGLLAVPFWVWLFRGSTNMSLMAPSGARAILRTSSTWRLLIARGLTDPVWYFLLFWFPKFLGTSRGVGTGELARIGWVVYLGAGLGTLAGGILSRKLVQRGFPTRSAYRWTMLIAAVLVPVSPLATHVVSNLSAVAVATVMALAHMMWLVTLTATIVEVYQPEYVGRAAGLIAMGSGFGGMLSSEAIGYLVTHGGYGIVFLLLAVLHPIAICIVWPVYQARTRAE